jgi:hypothetical protein
MNSEVGKTGSIQLRAFPSSLFIFSGPWERTVRLAVVGGASSPAVEFDGGFAGLEAPLTKKIGSV